MPKQDAHSTQRLQVNPICHHKVKLFFAVLALVSLATWFVQCTPTTPGSEPTATEQQTDAASKDAAPPEPASTDSLPTENQPPDSLNKPPLLSERLTTYVDPFIGTGGTGFAVGSSLPGATAPFGMLKVSPDTGSSNRGLNFQHCAGYYYLITKIIGFSHIHLHGTGVPDYGNLLTMPVVGDIDEKTLKEDGHSSSFSHDNEKAEPGYYQVRLDRSKTNVELTATTRTAHHRYTFDPQASKWNVLLRLDHALPGGSVTDGELTIVDANTIQGWLHSKGAMSKRGGGFELYFVLKTKQAMTGSGTWKDGKLDPASKSQKGASIGAWMTFAKTTNNEPIEFQVGISFVSIEQAKANLAAEQKGWTFETTRKQTSDAWEALLSTIKIAGGTKKQRRIFYTSMYHSFQMPTILADVDGTYRGFDKQVHTSKDFVYYSDFSMWDTYRTLHPLLVLLTPKRQRDMIHSLLAMARQGGDLPRWPLATGYTSTMIGASADIIIADSYLKGIKDFDVAFAYQVMRRLAMKSNPAGSKFGGRGGIEHYISKGFVDASKHSGSASMTMEYAYNDFSIAQLAKALGKTEDHKLFMERSTYYKNNWDKDTQFFRGKTTDGKWLPDFDPLKWTKDYVEGTAWQYLWFVPHDPDGLVSLFGSKDALFKKLDTFWTKSKDEHDNEPASLGPRKYYWHGNEPDLHAAFVYLQLGQAAKSHKWLRWIMENKYDDTPAGLPGNDDCGTLSAWYIFNAIGLYPIPGRDLYLISTPIFTRSQINVQGKTIEILAPKTSAKAIYVKAVYLNGKKLPDMWLKHTDLNQDGNVLRFEMSETP